MHRRRCRDRLLRSAPSATSFRIPGNSVMLNNQLRTYVPSYLPISGLLSIHRSDQSFTLFLIIIRYPKVPQSFFFPVCLLLFFFALSKRSRKIELSHLVLTTSSRRRGTTSGGRAFTTKMGGSVSGSPRAWALALALNVMILRNGRNQYCMPCCSRTLCLNSCSFLRAFLPSPGSLSWEGML